MEFAGVSEEDSHTTTLPADAGVPTEFPKWAYVDELLKAHERIAKQRARGQGEEVQFVSGGQQPSSNGAFTASEGKRSRFDDREGRHRGRG